MIAHAFKAELKTLDELGVSRSHYRLSADPVDPAQPAAYSGHRGQVDCMMPLSRFNEMLEACFTRDGLSTAKALGRTTLTARFEITFSCMQEMYWAITGDTLSCSKMADVLGIDVGGYTLHNAADDANRETHWL